RVKRVFVAVAPRKHDDAEFHDSVHLDAVALDHRVGEDLVRDVGGELLGLRPLGRRQIELEVLALPHVRDVQIAERLQRIDDRPALGIEHRWLQSDKHTRTHEYLYVVNRRASGACGAESPLSPSSRFPAVAELNTRLKM